MYVERTPYATYDFVFADFTKDANYHEFDLSTIVPVGATAVNLHFRGASTSINVNTVGYLRKSGTLDIAGTCRLRPQVAGIYNALVSALGIGPDRKIEYRVPSIGNFADLTLTVKGWWI